MNAPDDFLDATAQAELVRQKKASAVELMQMAIRKTEQLNPTLNAVVTPLFESGLDEARSLDARIAKDNSLLETSPPFLGVPFLIKDLDDIAGIPTTNGSRFFADTVPKKDSEITSRFRKAGLTIFGKTNTPELGLLPTTEPALFGACRNPWNIERTPGGSSGGAAAAVAAGIIPIAHANDGGGSIRIPASCCGLFGLKPSRGRTPGNTVTGLSVQHVITRSVRDSARMLDAIAGPMPWSPFPIDSPAHPFSSPPSNPRRLRIGFSDRSPTGERVHPDCAAAVHDAAKLCETFGHHVERAEPDIDGAGMADAFIHLWASACAAAVESHAAMIRREPLGDDLEPTTWFLLEKSRRISGSQLIQATGYLHSEARRIARFFETYDMWLTPTLAEPPINIGALDANREGGPSPTDVLKRNNSWVPFTPIANVTGQPAMSVPLNWNPCGLPIGVHFMGRFGDEASLLALAFELEQARPWSHRQPQIP